MPEGWFPESGWSKFAILYEGTRDDRKQDLVMKTGLDLTLSPEDKPHQLWAVQQAPGLSRVGTSPASLGQSPFLCKIFPALSGEELCSLTGTSKCRPGSSASGLLWKQVFMTAVAQVLIKRGAWAQTPSRQRALGGVAETGLLSPQVQERQGWQQLQRRGRLGETLPHSLGDQPATPCLRLPAPESRDRVSLREHSTVAAGARVRAASRPRGLSSATSLSVSFLPPQISPLWPKQNKSKKTRSDWIKGSEATILSS